MRDHKQVADVLTGGWQDPDRGRSGCLAAGLQRGPLRREAPVEIPTHSGDESGQAAARPGAKMGLDLKPTPRSRLFLRGFLRSRGQVEGWQYARGLDPKAAAPLSAVRAVLFLVALQWLSNRISNCRLSACFSKTDGPRMGRMTRIEEIFVFVSFDAFVVSRVVARATENRGSS